MRRFWVAFALATAACASTPPPNWSAGGSHLDIPRARWERGGQLVDIMPDGRVLIDGTHAFSIDVDGRVIDTDHSPIAVLQPDGNLVGQNRDALGAVGLRNASAPKTESAWLSIGEDGQVMRYRDNGDDYVDGKWTACGEAVRACTLTTQIVTLAEKRRHAALLFPTLSGPTVGIGASGASVIAP